MKQQDLDAKTRAQFTELLGELRALEHRVPATFLLSMCSSLDPIVTSMRQAAGVDVDTDAIERKREHVRRMLRLPQNGNG